MLVFDGLARYLAEERDTKPIFGLMGDANLGYLGAFIERHNGQFIAAALEGSAVSMGDGWARSSGDVAVVSITHGPALTNTLTALIEAVKSRSSMVLLTGSTPDVHDHFQFVDIEGFARYAGAGFVKVRTAAELYSALDKAFTLANTGQRPVVLDVPHRVLRSKVEYRSPRTAVFKGDSQLLNSDCLDETLGLLLSAKRPLLLAGRGAVVADSRCEILKLARLINSPVMTTLLAKDYFDGEPENLGICGGLATPTARSYLETVDVILTFGASLNTFSTEGFSLLEGKVVIQTDIHSEALRNHGSINHTILADSKILASSLVARLEDEHIETAKAEYMRALAAEPYRESKDLYISSTQGGFLDMRDATRWLSDNLPEGAQQVCDVGRFAYSTWPHITVDPRSWFYVGAFGSIGLGTATAIGAAVARPEVPTALYVGDGGAMQALGELHTAVRNGLPLIVMVLNDHCYGAEYLKLQEFNCSPEHSMMEWPSFARVAERIGFHTVRATSMKELEEADAAIEQGNFPLLIEIIADPTEVANTPGVAPLYGHLQPDMSPVPSSLSTLDEND